MSIHRLDTTMGSSGAVLSIVEATPFKELTHLALRVRPAHDGALKVGRFLDLVLLRGTPY